MDEDDVTHEMRCIYMDHLINDIDRISDLDFQQKAWVEDSIPGIWDTWEERMCMFFDDRNIDSFLADIDPRYGLSQQHIEALWKFRNIMRRYSDDTPQTMDPRDVIADPRWHQVVACAQETLKAFEGYRVPTDEELLN